MGVTELMGWRREQWAAAFAEQGLEFTGAIWHNACFEVSGSYGPTPTLGYFHSVYAAWHERHAYDPLRSPIILADTYRARAKC
jgi:hypothetical protein